MAGFADGLATGFGLVNSAYDRKSKEAYREESLAQDKINSDRTFELAQEKGRREDTSLMLEGEDNERKNKQFAIDQKTALQQIENDQVTNAKALTLLNKQNLAVDSAQREMNAAEATRKKNAAAVDAGVAATQIQSMNPTTVEEFAAANAKIQQVLDNPNLGHMFADSMSTIAQYEDKATFDAIKGLAEGSEITSGVFESGLEGLISATSWGREGATITAETHPNAPERMRGMKVVGSEIHSMSMGADNTVKAQVVVKVRNAEGQMALYLAPLSEKRAGDTAPISMNVDDLIKAFAGRSQFMGFMGENKGQIMETLKRSQYRTDAGDLDTNAYASAVAETKASEIQLIKDRGMEDSPIVRGSSITWGQFMQTQDFDNYVAEKTLLPDRRVNSSRDEATYLVEQLLATPEIKKINQRRATFNLSPMSPADVLKASVYFERRGDNLKAENSRAWNKFKSDMSGQPARGNTIGFREAAQAVGNMKASN